MQVNSIMDIQAADCMSGFKISADGKICAKFIFPADFIGFQGHFPDKPILPGICKILAVKAMLQRYYNRKLYIRQIVTAKFFAPVACGDELLIECRKKDENADGICIVNALVTCRGDKISKIELKIEKTGDDFATP